MFQGGSIWKPPPLKRMKPPPLPELQEIVKKGQLSTRFVVFVHIFLNQWPVHAWSLKITFM